MEVDGFSNQLNTFSPDGRLIQLEHAQKSSDQGTLICYTTNKEQAIIFFDLKNQDKMKIQETLVHEINKNQIYLCFSGLRPDSIKIIDKARLLCRIWAYNHKEEISINILTKLLGDYIQSFTITRGFRPFGCKIVLFGKNSNNQNMNCFVISCDGTYLEYKAGAIGAKSDDAITFLEQHFNRESNENDLIKITYNTVKNTVQGDDEKIVGFLVGSNGVELIDKKNYVTTVQK